MATTTLTTTADATSVNPGSKRFTRIVKIRNMAGCTKRSEDTKLVVPVRTAENPSPLKKSGTNRHPSQNHTRTPVDKAIAHELTDARYLMHDLADHVLGHIVSTELARDILRKFVDDRVVHVHERSTARLKVLLSPSSDYAKIEEAIQQAFEAAGRYDCIPLDNDEHDDVVLSPPDAEGKEDEAGKGKKKQQATRYLFNWPTFPVEPSKEEELVSFMNRITDRAFVIAKPYLSSKHPELQIQLRHRFAVPEDKYRAVPLSYEPDGEDMRPDFLLLPVEAFNNGFQAVDPKYINFTTTHLVGESKNKDLATEIGQMHRYARGLKRAQPWVHYVLGMAVTKDKAVFLRGEASGTESVEMMFADGRGCIEFIRILLGLALADQEDLGSNPDVQVGWAEQDCVLRNVFYHSGGSKSKGAKKAPAFSVPDADLLRMTFSNVESALLLRPSGPRSASSAVRQPRISSSSSKRTRSDMDDDEDGTPSKKFKAEEETYSEPRREDEENTKKVPRVVFFPKRVYEHNCSGMLFTTSSIRGRGTTVFCVMDPVDASKLLALKMAWQDLGRLNRQRRVMERLKSSGPHPNVIVPINSFQPKKNGKPCTTLAVIRGFLEDQIEHLSIENRMLTVSVSELKRPVQYFWGVHDFVRGLRGALLGHEYLTKIGVLHRDISENNIVLGRRPGDERGYLIDFDMAVLQEREECTPAEPINPFSYPSFTAAPPLFKSHSDDVKPDVKGLRTGTLPYISYNVLYGGKHTQFDDVESFLYVLLLFFFSYAGSLSETDLRAADEKGFAHDIGSGRLYHLRNWPKKYADWADGDPEDVAGRKQQMIVNFKGAARMIESTEFVHCLKDHWPEEMHVPICNLVGSSLWIFWQSTLRTVAKDFRTEVSHAEFIGVLNKWLDDYAALEERFSSCPFKHAADT